MDHIRNFDEFNESLIGDFFRKRSHSDEDIAIGILKNISKDILIEKESSIQHIGIQWFYMTEIDGFDVKIKNDWSPMSGDVYNLYVDGVELSCSDIIKNKIYKLLIIKYLYIKYYLK